MAEKSVITARVPDEVRDALDSLADRTGLSRATIIAKAVREYTEEQTAYLAFIEEGERAADEGCVVSQAEMEQWLAERIAEGRAQLRRNEAA